MKKIISLLSCVFLFASLTTNASDFLLNEYSVVTIGDFESGSGTHIAGSTFVGGDYTGGKSDLGQSLKQNAGIDVLTVAGTMKANVSTFQNDIVLSSTQNKINNTSKNKNANQTKLSSKVTLSSVGTVKFSSDLDAIKADYKTQLENSSEYFASLETNSKLVTTNNKQNNKLTVNNELGDNGIAVFSLDGFTSIFNARNQSIELAGNNISDLSAIVINVAGNDLSIANNSNINGSFNNKEISSKVIWNFYEATSIDLGSQKFVGAILAPLATVTQTGGNIYGSVGAFSLITNAEINVPTNVDITSSELKKAIAVPEPTSLILLLIAFAGLFYQRKMLNV
jgi:choice-of-anchor A domain-containing protein